MFDYETLKFVWWLLIGFFLLAFAVTDGYAMGIGTLLPFLGRNDMERRVVINAGAAHWEGNQVWLIVAGVSLFAIWPLVYATAFSVLYFAMLALVWALLFRPVGLDYRSKVSHPAWRRGWDRGLFAGGALPPLIFGIAFGNLLLGVPFRFEPDLRPIYTGGLADLLHPFALLTGAVSVAMLAFHGAHYIMIRSEGVIYERARTASLISGMALLAGFALAGIWIAYGIPGYRITSLVDPAAWADPLGKTVSTAAGAWLDNYVRYPLTLLVPAAGFAGGLLGLLFSRLRRPLPAFCASALAEAGIIGTAGVSMFPFILPSSTDPRSSLTIWDSASSPLSLEIMLWVTLVSIPLIGAYTAWAYRVMSGKITAEYVERNDHSSY